MSLRSVDITGGHYKWYQSLDSNTTAVGPYTELLSYVYVHLEFTNVLSKINLTSLMLIEEYKSWLKS